MKVIKIIKRVWSVVVTVVFLLCCLYAVFILGVTVYQLVTPTPPPKVETWQYEGHDMLRYEYRGEISVCHSPTCKKCCQAFD